MQGMELSFAVILMLTGAVLMAILISYVLSRNFYGRVNRAFTILMVSLLVWQICYSIQLMYMDAAIATGTNAVLEFSNPIPFWANMRYFGVALVGSAFVNLAVLCFLDLEKEKLKLIQMYVFAFPMVVIVALFISFLTQTEYLYSNHQISDGLYAFDKTLLYYYNMLVNYTFIFLGLAITIFKAIRPDFRLQKKQAATFILAVLIPFSSNVDINMGLGFYPTNFEVTPILFGLACVLFFIGIFRYKMFLIEPSKEVSSDKEASFDLSMGHVFTVFEETPLYSPEIFADLVRHDILGLAFLPNDLESLREHMKLPQTPMLRVGDKSTPNVLSYNDDDDLDYIKYLAKRFMEKSSNSVIIFGGLGKMLSERADEGKKFLTELQSFVSPKKSRIILSIPPGINMREDLKDMLTSFVEL